LVKCAKGFKKDKNGDCVKYVVKITCPKGSKYNKITKKCVMKVIIRIKCDKGFKLNPKTKNCEQVIITCPTGSKLVGDKCETPLVCDKGYKKVGDKCQLVKCPKGFKKEKNGDCVKIVIKITCPKGSTYNKITKTCLQKVIIRISCDKGFKLNLKTKNCEKVVITCPTGSKLVGDKCILPLVCDLGYKKVGDKCELIKCPKGFKKTKNGDCVKLIIKITCPKGSIYNKITKLCVQKVVIKISCDKGYTLNLKNNDCEKVVITCPTGSKLVGDKCIEPLVCGKGYKKVGDKCELEKCPKGFKREDNGDCVKIVIRITCPKGSTYNKITKLCVQKVIVKISCDKGYILNLKNNDCEKVVITCPKGYKLNGDNCIGPLVCDSGYKKVGDKCILIKCPKGFHKDKTGNCVKVTITLICPKGTKLNKKTKTCVKKVIVKISCKKGFKLNLKTKKCYKVIVPCPKGTKKVGDKCIKPLVCKKNYKKVGDKCQLVKCAKGFKRSKNGVCTKLVIKITCPKGSKYNKITKKCVMKVIVKISCKKGFKLNLKTKKCEKVIVLCPKGTKKVGDKCIRPLVCRKGYKKVGDKCKLVKCAKGFKRDKNGACVKIVIKITCPKGSHYNKLTKKCIIKLIVIRCGKGFKKNLKTKKCEKVIVPCPKGTKKVGDKCIKPLVCKKGYKKVDNQCKLVKCSKGFKRDKNGACVKLIIKITCPKGSKYNKITKKCVMKVIVKISCKKNFKLDLKTKKCVQVIITCPTGTKLNKLTKKCYKPLVCKKDYKKVGNKCILTKCPKGFKKVGSNCVKIVIKITCPKNSVYDKKSNVCKQKVIVKITCDKGWKLNKKSNVCEKTVVTCPKGFKFVKKNNDCEKIQILLVCDKGYKLNIKEKVCEKTIIKISCEKDFTLKGKNCIRVSCPKGETLKDDRCIVPKPQLTCEPGYTKDLKKGLCTKIIIIVKCDKGFKLIKGKCVKKIVKVSCPKGYR